VPEPFTVEDYRTRTEHLSVTGGAVVAASFQGLDQTFLLDALEELGDGFVGVATVAPDVTDREVLALYAGGVRAYRVNLFRGGDEDLLDLAPRLAELCGWHVELYVDGEDLPELAPRLRALPRVVIDHLGLTDNGLPTLIELVKTGTVHVKATGFGRAHLNVPHALRALADANPAALLFGTDLPSTRAPRPFHDEDLQLVHQVAGARALHANAAAVYYR
jgi:predicted TIM-barrel fold metal-dependent hydrolase